jgi:hypothetical protein
VIAEDRQRMRRDGAGADVQDARQLLPGDLEHVRDHQQQPLARREAGGERARLERSMKCSRGAPFTLHLDDRGDGTPEVRTLLGRPRIGQLAHVR